MKLPLRFTDWSYRTKMVALLMVASLLPLGVATVTNIREARERMMKTSAALLTARGDQLVQRLEAFHTGYQRSAARVARLPEIVAYCQARSSGDAESQKKLGTLLGIWTSSDPHIRGIAVLDPSGVVSASTEESLNGVDISYRKYVQAALRGEAAISDIHLGEVEVGNVPTIAYLSPVYGADNTVIGVVNISVRAATFWEAMRFSNELAGPASYAVVFDRQGIRLAHTAVDSFVFHPGGPLAPSELEAIVAENRFGAQTRQLLEDVRPTAELFERARADIPGTEVFRGYSPATQGWAVGVARRFKTVPWTAFYMIPEATLDAQIAEMVRHKTMFAGAIVIIAVFGGLVSAMVITRPIRSLAAATRAITAGDLAARVRAGGADELGRLAASFNLMADRIQAQDAALRNSRNDLEVRVRQRSDELTKTEKKLETESAERTQAEESLRQSEAQMQTIVENLDEGVVVADLNGRVLHCNRAGLELHGFTSVDQCRRHMREFADTFELSDADGAVLPLERWPLARVLRGELLHDLEVRIRRVHGDWQRVFSYGGTLVHDADGRPLLAVITISDITERQRAAEAIRELNADLERRVIERTEQLQTANNELEAFSYSVSHDLRAPLRTLDGFSQALMEDCADKLDAEACDNLRRIRGASQRMGQLIDDLINLSRMTRTEMIRQSVDLSGLAREIADELRAAEPGRAVEIVIAEGLTAHADQRLMRIALTNLLSNAWKFTSRQPAARIEFGSTGKGEHRTYTVRDNGVGFDMAHAAKLFGAFQRLHAARDFAGTGIGLATVQRIIHRHGGRIWAASSVGAGAEFSFTLGAW